MHTCIAFPADKGIINNKFFCCCLLRLRLLEKERNRLPPISSSSSTGILRSSMSLLQMLRRILRLRNPTTARLLSLC
jgi:hypothetical protein